MEKKYSCQMGSTLIQMEIWVDIKVNIGYLIEHSSTAWIRINSKMSSKKTVDLLKKIVDIAQKSSGFDRVLKNVSFNLFESNLPLEQSKIHIVSMPINSTRFKSPVARWAVALPNLWFVRKMSIKVAACMVDLLQQLLIALQLMHSLRKTAIPV